MDDGVTWTDSTPPDYVITLGTSPAWDPAGDWLTALWWDTYWYAPPCVNIYRSETGAKPWANFSELLHASMGSANGLHLSADRHGNLVLPWFGRTTSVPYGDHLDAYLFTASHAGGPWNLRVIETCNWQGTTTLLDRDPRAATDNRGHWTVVWSGRDTAAADDDIRYADFTLPVPTAAAGWGMYE